MKKIITILLLSFLLFSCNKEEEKEKKEEIIQEKNETIEVKEKISEEETQENVGTGIVLEEEKNTIYEPYLDGNITIDFGTGGYEKLENGSIKFGESIFIPGVLHEGYLDRGFTMSKENINGLEFYIKHFSLESLHLNDNFILVTFRETAEHSGGYSYTTYLINENNNYKFFFNNFTDQKNITKNILSKLNMKFTINIFFDNKDYIYLDSYDDLITNYFNLLFLWSKFNNQKLLEISYNLKYKPTQTLEQFMETYKDVKDLKIENIEDIGENKYKTLVNIDGTKYESIFEIVEDYKIKTISVNVVK